MKTLLSTIILTAISIGFLPQVNAAEAEVVWQNSDKYRDVNAGNGNRIRFKENTFAQLEKHFSTLAEKLPEGYMLKIQVDDLDLAGDVHIGGINQIRIVKDIFYPRIKFSYQLLSPNKTVETENTIDLKDMSFMNHSSLKYNNSSLSYEKKMLDDWFKETFSEYIL
ncbi:DUF3016 domain-containing protein [Thalassotalea piscium]